MPRVERFEIEIKTGPTGTSDVPRFRFNGHVLEFEGVTGGTESEQTFSGSFEPRSFVHELVLQGPETGKWDIDRIHVRYEVGGAEPYDVRFGSVILDETNAVNIWRPPPLPTFDV